MPFAQLVFGTPTFEYVRTAELGIGDPNAVSRRSPAPAGSTAKKTRTAAVAPEGTLHPVELPP
jgi:hypothetical protein